MMKSIFHHPIRFFLDFDGTVTTTDVVDGILGRFASDTWKKIEKDWQKGRIGSRECLEKQMALVQVSRRQLRAWMSKVRLDPGFMGFLKCTLSFSVPVVIVSDGFDWVIEEVFRHQLNGAWHAQEDLAVSANHLSWERGRLKVSFSKQRCPHGCANCKAGVIRRLRAKNERTVFVGDGLSDRFAAKEADICFAKDKLLGFCQKNEIPFKPYSTFKDIELWLIQNVY